MTRPFETLQEACAALEFQPVELDSSRRSLRTTLNQQLPLLCQAMPTPMQGAAIRDLQAAYAGHSPLGLAKFFDKFYAPTWTVLHWLHCVRPLTDTMFGFAVEGQAMAMFLHLLDDHLADGQLAASHLRLQLRTEAWGRYRDCAHRLSLALDPTRAVFDDCTTRYFATIDDSTVVNDLMAYESRFAGQLATGLVIPLLLARHAGIGQSMVREAFEHFGVAWRLLDDLRDWASDANDRACSAIWYMLDSGGRELWRLSSHAGPDPLAQHLLDRQVPQELASRMRDRLLRAASAAESVELRGWASEFAQLLPDTSQADTLEDQL